MAFLASAIDDDGGSPVPEPAASRTRWLITSLFFTFGMVISMNDVLIPKLKSLFDLGYGEAMLIQFCFFIGNLIVALPAIALISRIGAMRMLLAGGLTVAAGCLMFVPAAWAASYPMFLAALLILSAGQVLFIIAAAPLMIRCGPPETAHSRLSFGQGFNSLGMTIAPYIGAVVILGSMSEADTGGMSASALAAFRSSESAVVAKTYISIALLLGVIAIPIWLNRNLLGAVRPMSVNPLRSLDLLRGRRFAGGMLAMFCYVGAQVTVGSIMVNYLMQPGVLALDHQTAGKCVALYWAGEMVGRFVGAGILRHVRAGQALFVAASGGMALIFLSGTNGGMLAAVTLMALGLCHSIMYPTIFALATEGLGTRTNEGSGVICLAITGGAVVPLAAGYLADMTSLSFALLIPALCYAGIAGFAWFSRQTSPAGRPAQREGVGALHMETT
ncbi:sugar MFS transporter [Sphingobium phenoxybenzoativorans]|uniref:Sugar MFS transporter n=1 Tax=Sphingobium phenoxybenzoativorans TaxID=1592790 RepID=A0A975K8G5_9SPHN|nr:sugar MFS transporter [Sphingobium phenoxybenzoativorans]QUT06728.1 sugar MFS transporter [Sphingobium phenoxybenzoativorans]